MALELKPGAVPAQQAHTPGLARRARAASPWRHEQRGQEQLLTTPPCNFDLVTTSRGVSDLLKRNLTTVESHNKKWDLYYVCLVLFFPYKPFLWKIIQSVVCNVLEDKTQATGSFSADG